MSGSSTDVHGALIISQAEASELTAAPVASVVT